MNTNAILRAGRGLLILGLLLAAASPGLAQALNRCATAELPGATLELPDGSLHHARELTLCLRQHSPVSGIHELRIDGMPVGMVQSWIDESEGLESVRPVVVFQRNADRTVRLLGYAWPARDHMQIFLLRTSDGPDPIARADASELLEPQQERIFVAANLRRAR